MSAACEQHTSTATSKVMGNIEVGAGERPGDVSTVNGSIRIRENAVVATAHTVNGGLSLADGADVAGQLRNVNGPIRVGAAHVGAGIDTVSGGIELGPDAQVDGGIHVHKDNSVLSWSSSHVPRVVVGPGSRVGGTLNFERKVLLYVSDKATIGPVEGATVTKYSGERPPE